MHLVALFTEGVDWNKDCKCRYFGWYGRPLHRGCGLKYTPQHEPNRHGRRPLHRGCGLKSLPIASHCWCNSSPSSQRVWIEIFLEFLTIVISPCRPLHRGCGLKCQKKSLNIAPHLVALFTEGVDWNTNFVIRKHRKCGRPLHRGCGLKYFFNLLFLMLLESPSSQRVWIEIEIIEANALFEKVALFTEGVDWNIRRI